MSECPVVRGTVVKFGRKNRGNADYLEHKYPGG